MSHGKDRVPFDSLSHGKKKQAINATINLTLPQAINNLLLSSPDASTDRQWAVGILRELADRVAEWSA